MAYNRESSLSSRCNKRRPVQKATRHPSMANNRPPRRWWTRPRTFIRHILLADDTPHSIALGTAIGTFIGLTPTGGVQMLLVMLVAFLCRPLFRFNQIAALLMVYISNPLTAVPIY